ncbi:hypothetical protein AC1031_013487 [Aphanomyces cochlioides]|nr:hypothetical protein AC1031_013487 [Aphanomyces cochlioides]
MSCAYADGTCAKSQWQMGYGTEWVGPIPHVFVVMIPTGGEPQDLQAKKCLRAELYIAKFRDRLKSIPSFKIEPSDSCKMTPNAIAKRRKVGRGVSGDLCATKAELEAVMPAARKMNSANTKAAKYVLLKNDCMNFVANFMAIAQEKHALGAASQPRLLKAESPLSKQGSSNDLLSESLEAVYTDPALKKAAEELKKIEKGEMSNNALAKEAPQKAKKIL